MAATGPENGGCSWLKLSCGLELNVPLTCLYGSVCARFFKACSFSFVTWTC